MVPGRRPGLSAQAKRCGNRGGSIEVMAPRLRPTLTDPQMTEPWWKSAVIYQVYPRSFQDSNRDGVGDLPGILRRLPYLAGLGVDALWISPIFPSPMADFGYDISDYTGIDPLFGTMADFDALLAARTATVSG